MAFSPVEVWLAGELGFEPRQTESESVVLPLHHSPTESPSEFNDLLNFLTSAGGAHGTNRGSGVAGFYLLACGLARTAVGGSLQARNARRARLAGGSLDGLPHLNSPLPVRTRSAPSSYQTPALVLPVGKTRGRWVNRPAFK